MDEDLSSSGKTKQAKPSVSNIIGIDKVEIIGVWYSLSSNNWAKINPHERKQSDSKRLLIGKCDEIIHLEINCKAISIFAKIAKHFTKTDVWFFNVEIRENGKEKNNIKKAKIPKLRTGSASIFLMISLNTITNDCNDKILFLKYNLNFFENLKSL